MSSTALHQPSRDVTPPNGHWWSLTEDAFPTAMLLVALAAGIVIIPAQNDTWWHLHSGRTMWETGSLLTTERFSFASGGQGLDNHWWLTQLLYFAAFSIGGPMLLAVVAGAFAFGATVGAFRLTSGSTEVRLVLLIGLILCTAPEWSVRPQVVSLALLAATAHLIIRDKVWWLPIVCLFWGNAHAMVIFGVVMAGALLLEAIIWSRERLSSSVAILGLCAAAPMVSPLGWRYWPRVLATVSTSRDLQIQEYRTPLELTDLPFWLLVAALVWLTLRARKSVTALQPGRRAVLIAAFVLAAAAFSAARNIAFFAVLAAPSIAVLIPNLPSRRRIRPAKWPAYLMLSIEAAAMTAFIGTQWAEGGRALGWQPLEASAISAVRGCEGRLFNTLEDGGPLMWTLRDRPVFVDSRMEAYPQSLLRRSRSADLDGDYEELFREFGIECALVPTGSILDAKLRQNPDMTVTYSDASRTLIERRRQADARSRTSYRGLTAQVTGSR